MTTPEQDARDLVYEIEHGSIDADVIAGIADLYRDRLRMDFAERAFANADVISEWYFAFQEMNPQITLREFIDKRMAGNTAALRTMADEADAVVALRDKAGPDARL